MAAPAVVVAPQEPVARVRRRPRPALSDIVGGDQPAAIPLAVLEQQPTQATERRGRHRQEGEPLGPARPVALPGPLVAPDADRPEQLPLGEGLEVLPDGGLDDCDEGGHRRLGVVEGGARNGLEGTIHQRGDRVGGGRFVQVAHPGHAQPGRLVEQLSRGQRGLARIPDVQVAANGCVDVEAPKGDRATGEHGHDALGRRPTRQRHPVDRRIVGAGADQAAVAVDPDRLRPLGHRVVQRRAKERRVQTRRRRIHPVGFGPLGGLGTPRLVGRCRSAIDAQRVQHRRRLHRSTSGGEDRHSRDQSDDRTPGTPEPST